MLIHSCFHMQVYSLADSLMKNSCQQLQTWRVILSRAKKSYFGKACSQPIECMRQGVWVATVLAWYHALAIVCQPCHVLECMWQSSAPTNRNEYLTSWLRCMSLIIKARQKYRYLSWIVYDQNFCLQAVKVGNTKWASVDPRIYTQCFTGMALST